MTRAVDLGEDDPRPYVRLAANLRQEIVDGALTPGHPVPSITRLSREFGHARPTCGKALQLLEQEELLIRVPGLGYFVARSAV